MTMAGQLFLYPDSIVSSQWLSDHLHDHNLRVFECTMYLQYDSSGEKPVTARNARPEYEAGHIPGAGYLDLQQDLSEQKGSFRFTMPKPDALAKTLSQFGVGDGHQIVLYSRNTIQWSTRVWWMMHSIGIKKVAILDGGFETWVAEGNKTSTDQTKYKPATLTANPRYDLFVGKKEVYAAMDDGFTCIMNALTADVHCGEDARYGRPGHIPGSVNVPAASLQDLKSLKINKSDEVAKAFVDVGADSRNPVIVYCGGGVAATLNAFLLYQLGYKNVAVYDNSMSEWANNPDLPIEIST